MQSDDIVDRIHKLLTLATHPGTGVHEAEAAAMAANRLMLQYSISQERVDSKRAVDDFSGYVNQSIDLGKFAAWQRDLLVTLAFANLCRIVKTGRDSYRVIGPSANVAVTIEMFGWLRAELDRLAREAWQAMGKRLTNDYGVGGHMDPFRFHTSFKHGANASIANRLREEAAALKRESVSNSTALVLIGQRTDAALAHFYPRLRAGSRSNAGREVAGAAYSAGRIAGANVRLRRSKELGA